MDEHGIRGVTSNPTIFEKAMASGTDYDEQLRELTAAGRRPDDGVLGPGHRRHRATPPTCSARTTTSGTARDGFVSIEVDPDLAHDTDGTIAQAKELCGRLGRPNVMIKIPATAKGIPAITGDARRRHQRQHHVDLRPRAVRSEVIDAFLEGLEQRVAGGERHQRHRVGRRRSS